MDLSSHVIPVLSLVQRGLCCVLECHLHYLSVGPSCYRLSNVSKASHFSQVFPIFQRYFHNSYRWTDFFNSMLYIDITSIDKISILDVAWISSIWVLFFGYFCWCSWPYPFLDLATPWAPAWWVQNLFLPLILIVDDGFVYTFLCLELMLAGMQVSRCFIWHCLFWLCF